MNPETETWEFDNDMEPGAWIWVRMKGGATLRCVGSFTTLKACVQDAKKNGYVVPFVGGPIPLPVNES
jgi:hypothetical protein